MDFKKMLMQMAEAQADKMRDEAMGFISSDEFVKKVSILSVMLSLTSINIGAMFVSFVEASSLFIILLKFK